MALVLFLSQNGATRVSRFSELQTNSRLCVPRNDVTLEIFRALNKAFMRKKGNTYGVSLSHKLVPKPTGAYAAALPFVGQSLLPTLGWLYLHAAYIQASPFWMCKLLNGRNWPTDSKPREFLGRLFKNHHLFYLAAFFHETRYSGNTQNSGLILWPSVTYLWSPNHSKTYFLKKLSQKKH